MPLSKAIMTKRVVLSRRSMRSTTALRQFMFMRGNSTATAMQQAVERANDDAAPSTHMTCSRSQCSPCHSKPPRPAVTDDTNTTVTDDTNTTVDFERPQTRPPSLHHPPPTTFYRRPLPPALISFTSDHGKRVFAESLASGHAENYFSLVGNFTTQSEPAFCAPGSLAMVLNALEVDPGRQWKGIWRWYSDDNLDCCASDDRHIKEKGMTFREFACLARCNGLEVQAKRADAVTYEEFVQDLRAVSRRSDAHMVVSFHRESLGQTGDGHFSPVGLFNEERGLALVLDTARFKYPSYYAPVADLFEAMKPIDKETGLPRGYFILTRSQARNTLVAVHPSSAAKASHSTPPPLSICKLTRSLGVSNPRLANLFCRELPQRIRAVHPTSLDTAFALVLDAVPAEYKALVSVTDANAIADLAAPADEGHGDGMNVRQRYQHDLVELLRETRGNPVYGHVHRARQLMAHGVIPTVEESQTSTTYTPLDDHVDTNTALAAIFILASPLEIYRTLPPKLLADLRRHRDTTRMSPLMGAEVTRIGDQLSSLMNDYCQCHHQRVAMAGMPAVRMAGGAGVEARDDVAVAEEEGEMRICNKA